MRISLLGAPTLSRFTEGILRVGLERCGSSVLSSPHEGDYVIVQMHGSPAAREADQEMLEMLPGVAGRAQGVVVLLHRPDEIKDSMPQLRSVLSTLPPTVGVVMLGDHFIDDPFYRLLNVQCRVIPHGFFDVRSDPPHSPILVGSHTTWGEMRSVGRVLALLGTLARVGVAQPLIGYLGGGPAAELSVDAVQRLLEQLGISGVFTLRELSGESSTAEVLSADSGTLFLKPGPVASDFDLTFNVQLYHYGAGVRFGESSGSLHASIGIPVIYEMNGSEVLEDIRTVKVPYSDPHNADSGDFQHAAHRIADLIGTGEYKQLLAYNAHAARRWNNQRVAQLYVDFLEELREA